MSEMRFSFTLVAGILTMLLLAGCGGAIPGNSATTNPTPTEAKPGPTFTGINTAILPTATNPPGATKTIQFATVPAPAAGKLPTGPGVEWHLLVISESKRVGAGGSLCRPDRKGFEREGETK